MEFQDHPADPRGYLPAQTPAWLLPAISARVTEMINLMGGLPPVTEYPMILLTLNEPPEGSSEQFRREWERTCDHCHKHCPDPEQFYTGSITSVFDDGQEVTVVYGACPDCAIR